METFNCCERTKFRQLVLAMTYRSFAIKNYTYFSTCLKNVTVLIQSIDENIDHNIVICG